MFDRAFKRVNTFEDIRTELVKKKEKRAGEELIQESTKKQKVEDDKEKAELKQLMETISDEEEVAINVIPLAIKSLRIVDWKIHREGLLSLRCTCSLVKCLKVLTGKIWKTCTRPRNANHTQTLDLADIYGRFVYEDNLIQRSEFSGLAQLVWVADVAMSENLIRRIENWSNALSCEVQALIRRISFAGYGILPKIAERDDKPESQWTPDEWSLPKKWLTVSQGLRNANHTQTLDLADIYGRFVYEDNLFQRSQAKPKCQKDYKAKYKKIKAKLAQLEEVISDDEEVIQVKVLIALSDDELIVGKNPARNGLWIDITMKKVNILFSMDEDADWQNNLKYINIDLKFVEEQRLNLLSKILYCMICKKEDHRTSDHEMYTASLKKVRTTRLSLIKVIALNEHKTPHIEDTEGPPDLINTEETHEQNVQDEQIITQPTEGPFSQNTKVSLSINETLVPDIPQSYISNQASTSSHLVPRDRWSKDQHIKLVNIIGNPGKGMLTRSMAAKLTTASASECLFVDFLSKIEPKKVSKALKHLGWVDAMQEELNQFYKNKVWSFVPLPYGKKP
uniref:Retrovirus-related Pol polyprotein from transposon TNT 1-94 n=1 Tax=Tanacetum cinerariifolium TaxID=118510 RepID=A0A6L2JVX4_TANCI|nr:retrovirus-related Pol polyprotein from transposon TNT 1-94 [Tanacetum cinerariifolium]